MAFEIQEEVEEEEAVILPEGVMEAVEAAAHKLVVVAQLPP